MPVHDTLVAPGAIHPAAFVGPIDPALTPTNYVAAGKFWVDTTGGGAVLKMRDAANTAWELVGLPATTNLLTNPGYEIWSRGPGPFSATAAYAADRWQLSQGAGSTMSVSRDSANADLGSQYCAAITYTHAAASRLIGRLEDQYAPLRGRTVTFAVRVRVATGSAVRLSVWDSVNLFRYSAYHTGSGAYETLSVTAPIAAAATGAQVGVWLEASCIAQVDNAVLAVGAVAPPYVPLHPADELHRCQRYYEVLGGAALSWMMDGYSPVGPANKVVDVWSFKASKAITPTLTLAGTPAYTNCSALTPNNPSLHSCRIYTQVTAPGAFQVALDSPDDLFIAEANP